MKTKLKLLQPSLSALFFLSGLTMLQATDQNEELPQILIIGDSISLGYTPVLQGMLYGEVDIRRPLNHGGGWINCEGTKLIFATTTPYPDKPGGPLRRADQPGKYNEAALKIMEENGIPINDLHAFVLPRMEELLLPNNVHFRPSANLELAEIVADHIRKALEG